MKIKNMLTTVKRFLLIIMTIVLSGSILEAPGFAADRQETPVDLEDAAYLAVSAEAIETEA